MYVRISRGNARWSMVLRQKMEDYVVERLKFIVSAVPKVWLVWIKLIYLKLIYSCDIFKLRGYPNKVYNTKLIIKLIDGSS